MKDFPLADIFGMPVTIVGNYDTSGLPRIYSSEFTFKKITIGGYGAIALMSENKIDLKMTLKIIEKIQEKSDDPCIVCSSTLSFYQREILAGKNIAFILSPNYYFIPFLGTRVESSKNDAIPKTLSPQAQRLFLNIFYKNWLNYSASEIASEMNKSNASVSKYFKEIESISPSLIETNGRFRRTIDSKTMVNTGFSSEEVLERFEPYLSSPVIESMLVKGLSDAKVYAQLGAKYAGFSALAAKTDLAYPEIPTYMFTEEEYKQFVSNEPQAVRVVYDRVGADAQLEIWKYESDFSDPRLRDENGIESVDELSLYLSLKDNPEAKEPRIQYALDQIRSDACRY